MHGAIVVMWQPFSSLHHGRLDCLINVGHTIEVVLLCCKVQSQHETKRNETQLSRKGWRFYRIVTTKKATKNATKNATNLLSRSSQLSS